MNITLRNSLNLPNYNLSAFPFTPFDTRMYVLTYNNQCLVIDPAKDESVIRYLQLRDIKKLKILLTHEHFDHLTGVNMLKCFFDCELICSKVVGDAIKDEKKNLSFYHDFMVQALADTHRPGTNDVQLEAFTCNADSCYESTYDVSFAGLTLKCIPTPGHSKGSCCILVYDELQNPICIFTGDSLMKDYLTHTNLPGGSKKTFKEVTRPFLLSLPENIIVYPGHGEDAILRDIKNHINEEI